MTITIVIVAVIVGGIVLALLARWARKRNASLGDDASAWGGHRESVSFTRLFFGTRSSLESRFGQLLVWGAILLVAAFLAFAGYVILVAS